MYSIYLIFQPTTTSTTKPRKLTFKLKSSFDTGLTDWGKTRSCLLTNGDVVLYGKTTGESDPNINVYKSGTLVRSLRPPCQHESIILQPVLIQGSEYIAISCGSLGGCHEIYLLDLLIKKVTGYKSPDLYPGKMCVGDEGSLYVEHLVKGERPVVKLDITDEQFKEVGHRVNSQMESIYGLHYTHTGARNMLLFTRWRSNTIEALHAETGDLIWKVNPLFQSFKNTLFSSDLFLRWSCPSHLIHLL